MLVTPNAAPVLAFAIQRMPLPKGMPLGIGRKHRSEAEESISIVSPKVSQKVKLIYWKRHYVIFRNLGIYGLAIQKRRRQVRL